MHKVCGKPCVCGVMHSCMYHVCMCHNKCVCMVPTTSCYIVCVWCPHYLATLCVYGAHTILLYIVCCSVVELGAILLYIVCCSVVEPRCHLAILCVAVSYTM